MTDTLVPPLDTSEKKCKAEEKKGWCQDIDIQHDQTGAETTMQEEKYGIYTSTLGYEGDDSDIDSDVDTDSDMMAYPFLEWKNNRKPEIPSPP